MRRGRTPLSSFHGRVGRLAYFIAQLVVWVLMTILLELAIPLAMDVKDSERLIFKGVHLPDLWSWTVIGVTVLLGLVIGLSSLSFQVRRFHDCKLTGWCIFLFVPLTLIPFPVTPSPVPNLALLMWTAILIACPVRAGATTTGRTPANRAGTTSPACSPNPPRLRRDRTGGLNRGWSEALEKAEIRDACLYRASMPVAGDAAEPRLARGRGRPRRPTVPIWRPPPRAASPPARTRRQSWAPRNRWAGRPVTSPFPQAISIR